MTDPEGRILRSNYDSSAKLISTIVDWGRLNLTTTISYDAIGNIDTTIDPNGNLTDYDFDNERRLTATTLPAPFDYISEIDYDKNGRVIEQRTETGDAIEPLQIIQTEYTLSDKIKNITNAEGHITRFEYDNADRLFKTIDAENRIIETEYYPDSRLYRQYRYLDGSKIRVAEYDYTANGQPSYVEDANGNRTYSIYDEFDRLQRTEYPDASFQQVNSYDDNGNIESLRTRAGDIINYDYDALNRRINKDLPGTDTDVSYQYDLSGLSLVVTQTAGNHVYSYDTAGRLEQETQPDGKVIQQQYDANGNRSVLVYPDNYTLHYNYDELNRLDRIDEINQQTQSPTTIATFDYIDRLNTQLTYANGVNLIYQNTIGGQLQQLEHHSGNNTLVSYDLLYNNVGELINRNSSGTDYDWQPSAQQTIDYTANELNQYDTIKFDTNTYDDNGNFITNGDGTSYTYDSESQLISAITPQNNINYVYDAFGRRIQQTIVSQITRYSYDGSDVLAEYDNSGQLLARYVHGPNIDQPLFMERSGNRYYYHPDPQGSIVALSDSSGNVVETYAYGPFGEGTSNDSFDNPYRYTARRYDEETGLYYYRARYYDAEWGRFLQPDPSGYGDGLNLYAYVGNSPVSFVDPSGLARDVASGQFGLLTNNPEGYLPSAPQGLVDGVTGFGDGVFEVVTLGFGDLGETRNALGIDGSVDTSSLLYTGTYTGGAGVGLLATGGAFNVLLRPVSLTHFTSSAAASSIYAEGVITASGGLYGNGVYASAYSSRLYAAIQGARSTEVAITFSTQGLNVAPTFFPGTFRVLSSVILP